MSSTASYSESLGFDVCVIGAGLGGLLAASQLTAAGMRVLVTEKLKNLGGRFSNNNFQGYALSTGALHFVPHGPTGVLGQALSRIGLNGLIQHSNVFASMLLGGKHTIARRPINVLSVLSPREKIELVALIVKLKFNRQLREPETFDAWLRRHTRSEAIIKLWRRFAEFALSVDLDDIAYEEMREIVRAVAKLGDPGIVPGGCGNITGSLARFVEEHNGAIRSSTEVTAVTIRGGEATGVELLDRTSGDTYQVDAAHVISDIGPAETTRLLPAQYREKLAGLANNMPVAAGMKVHLRSDKSLISHTGIMFCLDTQRISGIVQPSNVDPALAPPGQHLLITFQMLKSDDLAEERRLALEDLNHIFGADFENHCEVLAFNAFRGDKWPVNRAKQGWDLRLPLGVEQLWLVGDGVKPPGYMMAEGVAKSVDDVVSCIIKAKSGDPPSKCGAGLSPDGSLMSYMARVLRLSSGTG